MSWTTPEDIRNQVRKLWDRGALLACLLDDTSLFPLRMKCKGPDSRELSERFSEARNWIGQLKAAAGFYHIEWRSLKHRVLGSNDIPVAIRIDRRADALNLIGKIRDAERFAELAALIGDRRPEWRAWLKKRPLRALELDEEWPRLLRIADWLLAHPRPAIYLRQIDLPGIHSKWIEGHRGLLAELLDLVLPEAAIDRTRTGVGDFCRRYGFLDKPSRVRFRILDANVRLLPGEAEQDLSLTQAAFASLDLPLSKVFIIENEINFLAFPAVAEAMVIFGAGYGFDALAAAAWLRNRKVFYWGDIDTHGFAILNQLRGILPHVTSFLMDQQTLFAHRPLWGTEVRQETGILSHLTAEESELYDQLRQNRWGEHVRLEQERIGFDFLQETLRKL